MIVISEKELKELKEQIKKRNSVRKYNFTRKIYSFTNCESNMVFW